MTAGRSIIFATTFALLTGCASTARKPDSAQTAAVLNIIQTLPAEAALHADEIYPQKDAVKTFALAGGGGELIVRVESTTEHGASFAMHEGDARTTYLKSDDRGRLVMTAVYEADDNAISLFNPPLVVAPTELAAGETVTSESAMKVIDSKDRKSVRESGKATRTITYVDDQRIRIPAGEFTAKRIAVEFKADLNLAKASDSATLWISPNYGIIAEQREEQVKVLGIAGSTKARTMALKSAH